MAVRRKLTWKDIGQFFTCSCGHEQAANELMPWCSVCGCEYDINTRTVTLQPERKTERYAWGKALNLSGGVRIGKVTKTGD